MLTLLLRLLLVRVQCSNNDLQCSQFFYTPFLAQHNHSSNFYPTPCAILSFCMPCPFSTWVIIGLHIFLTFLDILFLFLLYLLMSVLPFIYEISLGRSLADFICSILPSVCPLGDRVSKSTFLNMCPRHFLCLFLKLIISCTVVCISLSAMLHELNVVIFYV